MHTIIISESSVEIFTYFPFHGNAYRPTHLWYVKYMVGTINNFVKYSMNIF